MSIHSSEELGKVSGGLDAFKQKTAREQETDRELAILAIKNQCTASSRAGIVTGHFMFWENEHDSIGKKVCTENDLKIYTHIVYLDVPTEEVAKRRANNDGRGRSALPIDHLNKWQQEEKTQICQLCRENGILFAVVTPPPSLNVLDKVAMLLSDFQLHSEEHNLTCAKNALDDILAARGSTPSTMLIIDADKTLAAEDAGPLYFQEVAKSTRSWAQEDPFRAQDNPLKALFSGPMGYGYGAFRQATLLFEETLRFQEPGDEEYFNQVCAEVAREIHIYADFVCLLKLISQHDQVSAVIVSCGLRGVWEKVLKNEGLAEIVKVIAGGRIANGYVVNAAVKGNLVTHLRETHHISVVAFGDSPLDLEMLAKANDGIIVVGKEDTRSKSMDSELENAVGQNGNQLRQVLLPPSVTPRLHNFKLPFVKLTDHGFIDGIFGRQTSRPVLELLVDRTKASPILTGSARDAAVAGPDLRRVHGEIGRHLARVHLADVAGLDMYPIKHVQDRTTHGFRLWRERQTTIVALMRGGEPMAFGVNDAFPLAMFVHASEPEDVKPHHLDGQVTVVLVDSVVNSGKTVVQFMEHVRKLHPTIRIVVMAYVVQQDVVEPPRESVLIQQPSLHKTMTLITLRTSKTKFTGSGTTDTGNRLFNTTHLKK